MNNNYFKLFLLTLLVLTGGISQGLRAQTLNGEQVTLTWPMTDAGNVSAATVSPETNAAYISNSYETHGSNLSIVGTVNTVGHKQTQYTPLAKDNSVSENGVINFMIRPKAGLTFTPTKVSLKSTRYGTNGGNLDFKWVNSDGTTVELATGRQPERDNTGDKFSVFSYDVTGAQASSGACGLRIYLYKLDPNRKVGFADVVIEGTLSGTVQDVKQYTLSVSAQPAEAGEVSVNPVGTVFDEGTEVTLTHTRNFGYRFTGWTDATGKVISTDDTYKFTINAKTTVVAAYEKVNTYALSYTVTGGAADYMVSLTPEPTVIDGKNMYEENTKVTLTAASNPILTFSNWSNGETSAEIAVNMTADTELTADYSAVDYLAGWDFYKKGNAGRKADFYSADNDVTSLVMRDADGNNVSWLDKSTESGGYEGRPAAVNWSTAGLGKYYWQTMVNASQYQNLKLTCAMLYNFKAYQKYNIEYSLDGAVWKNLTTVDLGTTAKVWKDTEVSLPSEADNQEKVYIRWIADTTSDKVGTDSNNDGIAISGIYITGDEALVDDGRAPVLVSSVPAEGSNTASANGKVVLTFDEKVKVADGATATLDGKELTPVVSGKSVMFEYRGLAYDKAYTFILPAGSIADLTDNYINKEIRISFTTRTRPVVEKAMYDFIVPVDGSFKEAIAAADKRENKQQRFRIFIRQGDYTIPASETSTVLGKDGNNYPSPITTLNSPNVSIIGEGIDNTTIVNTVPDKTVPSDYGPQNVIEGLGKCETLELEKNATGTYMQDLTIRNGLKDNTGRGAALEDNADKTICKNVCLYGYQDTYLSDNERSRYYFEGGKVRGRTDFLCGKGDVFYNGVDLVMCGKGYLAVPSIPKQYGYIFKDCTIKGDGDGTDGQYTLGRPWGKGTPIALFIDTRMEVIPSAAGWDEMSGGWPARFAEYNSTTSTGSTIDLSNRKKIFADTHENNPVLTEDEAKELTLDVVMGGDDNWDPTASTEQASAPTNVKLEGHSLTWDNSNYVLCWAVCQDGKVIGFTTENKYTVTDAEGKYSVRAANEMGGLGEAAEATGTATGISNATVDGGQNRSKSYNLQGIQVKDTKQGGVYIRDGKKYVGR